MREKWPYIQTNNIMSWYSVSKRTDENYKSVNFMFFFKWELYETLPLILIYDQQLQTVFICN